jgi:hypothetical protein
MAAFGIAWGLFWLLGWTLLALLGLHNRLTRPDRWAEGAKSHDDNINLSVVVFIGFFMSLIWTLSSVIWYLL